MIASVSHGRNSSSATKIRDISEDHTQKEKKKKKDINESTALFTLALDTSQ